MTKTNTRTTRPRYRLAIPDDHIPTDICLLLQYLQADEGPYHPEYYLLKMRGWESPTPEAVTELVYVEQRPGLGRAYIAEDFGYSVSLGCSLRNSVENFLKHRSKALVEDLRGSSSANDCL
jgi:hypothetical protein